MSSIHLESIQMGRDGRVSGRLCPCQCLQERVLMVDARQYGVFSEETACMLRMAFQNGTTLTRSNSKRSIWEGGTKD